MARQRLSLAAHVILTLTTGISACSRDPNGTPDTPPPVSKAHPEAAAKVAKSGNDFTFALLRQISSAQPGENVFISPLSASMTLGMIMNGAHGKSYEEMRATLGFSDLQLDEINHGYRDLIASLRAMDPATDFRIANSVWYRNSIAVAPAFLSTTNDFFGAKAAALDFTAPSAVTTINGWVSSATEGKIPTIITEIRPEDVMFLINAIYFKGAWREQFDPKRTYDAEFTRADGTKQTVRMMTLNTKMRLTETPDFEALDLLYGDSSFSMTILLPKTGKSVNDVVDALTMATWSSAMQKFTVVQGDVRLPKFTLTYERTLNDDLKALGITTAFDEMAADFSRIGTGGEDMFLSFVKQKTYVEVDEAGTKAAAVTVGGIGITSLPPQFTVDRPFVFAIRERKGGTMLFIGKVTRIP